MDGRKPSIASSAPSFYSSNLSMNFPSSLLRPPYGEEPDFGFWRCATHLRHLRMPVVHHRSELVSDLLPRSEARELASLLGPDATLPWRCNYDTA